MRAADIARQQEDSVTEEKVEVPAPVRGASTFSLRLRRLVRRPEVGVVPIAGIVFLVFSLMTSSFVTAPVWGDIESLTSELGIVAVAVTLLMIAGEFDLTVGSVLGLSTGMVVVLSNSGLNIWLAVVITMCACGLIGLVNAVLVTRVGLPSLIVTIGGLMFYRGIDYVVTGGNNVTLSSTAVASLSPFNKTFGFFSIEGFWFIGVAICATLVLSRTQLGNWIFAAGGNRASAVASGIPVRRVKGGLFVLSALAAGFEGVLQVARLTSVDGTAGTNVELEAILAVVVGGTALMGGTGGVIGTVFGVVILAMSQLGLVLVGVPAYWYQAGIGLFLVVTVAGNQSIIRRVARGG